MGMENVKQFCPFSSALQLRKIILPFAKVSFVWGVLRMSFAISRLWSFAKRKEPQLRLFCCGGLTAHVLNKILNLRVNFFKKFFGFLNREFRLHGIALADYHVGNLLRSREAFVA